MAEYDEDMESEEADLLDEIRSRFTAARDHWRDWREEARQCFKFYAGHQWSEEDKEKLLEQQRQPITFNRVAPFIDAVLGHEANNRQEIRYIPRSSGDGKVNEVLTQIAQFFLDKCDGEYAQSDAFRDMLICGMGWTETRLDDEDNPEYDLIVESVNPLEMLPDPSSSRPCFMDARYIFRVQNMSKEEARSIFPKWSGTTTGEEWDFYADEDEMAEGGDASARDSYRDDDSENSTNRDIVVLQYQHKEYENFYIATHPVTGERVEIDEDKYEETREEIEASGIRVSSRRRVIHKRCFMIGNEIVQQDVIFPKGFTFNAVTGKRDRAKKVWIGLMHAMIDPQMWSNKFLSQMLHIINSQAKGGVNIEESSVDNISEFEAKYARPGAVLVFKDGALVNNRVQERTSAQFPAAFDRLLQYANESFGDVTGINAELLGMADREQAGVLEYQRRQSAVALLAPLFDSLRLYRKMFGRVWLYYIQNYVSDGRIARITIDQPGPDGNPQAKQMAVPVTPDLLRGDGVAEYDVIVDQAASAPNQKEATWAVVSQLGPVLKDVITPPVLMKLLEYSPLPESLMEELKMMAAQEAQNPKPDPEVQKAQAEMQMKAQAQQQDAQIKAESKRQEIELKKAEAQAELELKRMELQAELEMEREKMMLQMQIEAQKHNADMQLQREKADFDKAMKAELTSIDAESKRKEIDYASSKFGPGNEKMTKSLEGFSSQVATSNAKIAEALAKLAENMSKPKTILRGPDGRAIGVQ